MSDPITGAVIFAATSLAAGTSYSIYSGIDNASEQKSAQGKARDAANAQANLQEQATNAANKKKPDITSILAAAQQASKGGGNSTMLTGPQGAAPSTLGSSSLLGS